MSAAAAHDRNSPLRCPALLAVLLLTLTAATEGRAEIVGPFANPQARLVMDLGGAWEVIVDPVDNGSIDYLSRPRREGYWADRRPASPSDLVEYAFTAGQTLAVPGDWNTQRPELFFYEGIVWYRRAFQRPEGGDRFFLRFGAANRRATVWLNGKELGTHEVGFTPFTFEVTEDLKAGENVLIVKVDNRRLPDDVPGLLTDWWNDGGLTREVGLLATPRTFVRDWSIGLVDGGAAVGGWVRVDGPDAAHAIVRVRMPGPGLEAKTRADADGVARFTLPSAMAGRWSPDRPTLHDLEFEIAGDRAHDTVGLRLIEARGGDILLNGERVFLRGISIHGEAPEGGRAWSEAHARELLGWAKDLGCNFVRLAHYPHDEDMLRVADELGLMVWAEIPVYWVMDYASDRTMRLARTHLEEMIARDRNRACIVIWSVGNETGADPDRTAFRVALGERVKTLDPSRLLSAACFATMDRRDGRLATIRVNDPFGEIADVLAINQYVGWYHDTPESLQGVSLELGWDKPFLVSEFGAGVKQGRHGPPEERWTEEYGVRLYEATLDWLEGLGALDGVSPWILKDFRSPRRPLPGVQDWYNRKGLVSETGERKAVFGVLRDRYERWSADPPGR